MRSGTWFLRTLLIVAFAVPLVSSALAQGIQVGNYLWYAPEHEIYGRTEFYTLQDMKSAKVRVIRTQRFKILAARYNWALLEFDVAGKAYIPVRMLRYALYDPTASDPWHEFKRASVFSEEPAKIEARLKAPPEPTPATVDSKTPAWKRYKEAWGLKPTRPTPAAGAEGAPAEGTETTQRPVAGTSAAKPRNKHPLLPPIGSEPRREPTEPETPERDAEAAPSR